MIRLLKFEIKSITANSKELQKTIEKCEQELQKKKLVEQLLAVKTDIEEELKTQVCNSSQVKALIHKLIYLHAIRYLI